MNDTEESHRRETSPRGHHLQTNAAPTAPPPPPSGQTLKHHRQPKLLAPTTVTLSLPKRLKKILPRSPHLVKSHPLTQVKPQPHDPRNFRIEGHTSNLKCLHEPLPGAASSLYLTISGSGRPQSPAHSRRLHMESTTSLPRGPVPGWSYTSGPMRV